MRWVFALLAGVILAAASFHAVAQQDQIERMTTQKMENFELDKIEWKDEPVLPGDAQSALVIGDPTKPGVFMAYLKFPAN